MYRTIKQTNHSIRHHINYHVRCPSWDDIFENTGKKIINPTNLHRLQKAIGTSIIYCTVKLGASSALYYVQTWHRISRAYEQRDHQLKMHLPPSNEKRGSSRRYVFQSHRRVALFKETPSSLLSKSKKKKSSSKLKHLCLIQKF